MLKDKVEKIGCDQFVTSSLKDFQAYDIPRLFHVSVQEENVERSDSEKYEIQESKFCIVTC
jgi:hypothetical protein